MRLKIPAPIERGLVFAFAIGIAVILWAQLVPSGKAAAFDPCAAANLRSCKVVQQGDWTLVAGSDNHQVLILMKDGKVVQVLQ